MAKFGPNLANSSQSWAKFCQVWSNSAKFGPCWQNVGRVLAQFGQIRPKCWPTPATSNRSCPNVGHNRPKSANIGPTSTNVGRCFFVLNAGLAMFCQTHAFVYRHRRHLLDIARNAAQLSPNLARFGRNCAKVVDIGKDMVVVGQSRRLNSRRVRSRHHRKPRSKTKRLSGRKRSVADTRGARHFSTVGKELRPQTKRRKERRCFCVKASNASRPRQSRPGRARTHAERKRHLDCSSGGLGQMRASKQAAQHRMYACTHMVA